MNSVLKQIKSIFPSAVLAGIVIGLGGLVFLSLDSKVLGSLFFTVGLFTICTRQLHLFTGKVCYVFENPPAYAAMLPVIWLGNFTGTWLLAKAVSFTRLASLSQKAAILCEAKQQDSLLSLFLLGVFCNILIFIAVDGYKENPHTVGKYLALFFGVTVFILAGTEHCVADMFYFGIAGQLGDGDTLARLLVITAGNICGGVLLPLIKKWTAAQ